MSGDNEKVFFLSFPRKGTETLSRRGPQYREASVFSYLFPARGRKPAWLPGGLRVCEGFFPIFSPQGDGNSLLSAVKELGDFRPVFSYLFPARGRKQSSGDFQRGRTSHVFSYLFPARGRKPTLADCPIASGVGFFPIFSPQGDGNKEYIEKRASYQYSGQFFGRY